MITYKLKIDNYLFQILTNWFKPAKAQYLCLKDDGVSVRDKMGDKFILPANSVIKVIGAMSHRKGERTPKEK